ncbi:MAG: hypothetical protein L0K86_08145 [Actinomycetia bacterium]|nr:hypothetical protein [Actinomycetes bacterium]
MRSTRRFTAYASALAATVALAGCGGDEASEPEEPTTPDSTSQTTTNGSGDAEQATSECVGDDKGSITVTSDEAVDLPGGSTATMASADMTRNPPTVSFDLGKATKIEQDNAKDLSVGDQFGVARVVYVVARICTDEAMLDEF